MTNITAIGLDVHKRESQVCVRAADDEYYERRIPTTRAALTDCFGPLPPAPILLEASTDTGWVVRLLTTLGHDAIFADPNFAPMYSTRSKKIKTDKRDARALADACALGAYRRAHQTTLAQRHVRGELVVRELLVRTRAKYIVVAKALLQREGLKVSTSAAEHFASRLQTLLDTGTVPADLAAELTPLLHLFGPLQAEIDAAAHRLTAHAATDPRIRRLLTIPGIGPVTATAFVAVIDDVARFPTAHHLEAYLGLVPGENSSAERQRRGHITKTGNPRVRYLLVEAGWHILARRKQPPPGTEHLRAWALALAQRRGRTVAAVAVARRLAGICYALWRDETEYRPAAHASDGPATQAA
jgi:transposase